MFFDTHTHAYFPDLKTREAEVFANMLKHNVTHSVQIGADIAMSLEAIRLAKTYPNTFATVGIHPTDAQDFDESVIDHLYDALDRMIESNRSHVVAVGEIGFDFFHLSEDAEIAEKQKNTQELFFEAQAALSHKWNLPVIIHTRSSNEAVLEGLQKHAIKRAVIHCFSEDIAFAKACQKISSEIYFSFSGILTYKKSDAIREVASTLPLDRILIETDAPFLSPQAVRGTINESANVRYVFEELCRIRSEDPKTIEDTLFENSKRFFGIR